MHVFRTQAMLAMLSLLIIMYLCVCFSSFQSESQGLEPICIALGENNTAWALDTGGSLWFRTGVTAKKPQGDDDHWWQVGIQCYPHSGGHKTLSAGDCQANNCRSHGN